MKDKMTFNMMGYRDVHWCCHLNEPFIIEYNDNCEKVCPLCNSFEIDTHPFILHILKPAFGEEDFG